MTNPPDAPTSLAPAGAEPEIEDMQALLDSAAVPEPRQLRRGEVVEGTIMSLERDGALIDIGFKSEGVVPTSEMHSLGSDPMSKLSAGEQVLVYVVQAETAEGQVALSIDRARGEQGWRVLQTRFEDGDIFEAEVTGFNKGGLLANVEGVNAFIPMSQVVGAKPGSDGANPLSSHVGRTLRLKVIEINRRRNRVILSERAALQEWRAEQKDRLLQELTEGEIRIGSVTSIRNFGVFVDLGGADGLVHLSEISWDRNTAPEDLLKIGDEVKVFVMKVDMEAKKIALSIRRASPEQWEELITQYSVGDVVPGVVTKLVAFGAFARLPGPVEGLVHVSELVDRRIGHPDEVVDEEDVVPLKIVRIEHDRHRLGLSLREARSEAQIRGWRFDGDGRVIEMGDAGREAFPEEAAAVEQRYAARKAQSDQAAAASVASAGAPSAAPDGRQQAPAAPKDEGPVLTAMQAAMQQAQADLKAQDGEPAAVEETEAEAPAAEAPAAEDTVTDDAATDDAATEDAEAEAPSAEEAEAEAPAAEETAAEEPAAEAEEEEPAAEETADEKPEASDGEEETAEAESETAEEETATE